MGMNRNIIKTLSDHPNCQVSNKWWKDTSLFNNGSILKVVLRKNANGYQIVHVEALFDPNNVYADYQAHGIDIGIGLITVADMATGQRLHPYNGKFEVEGGRNEFP